MTHQEHEEYKLVAKACGFSLGDGWDECLDDCGIVVNGTGRGDGYYWNPKACDGDALRLAVSIGKDAYFGIEIMKGCTQADTIESWELTGYKDHDKYTDPFTATRLAIWETAVKWAKEKLK